MSNLLNKYEEWLKNLTDEEIELILTEYDKLEEKNKDLATEDLLKIETVKEVEQELIEVFKKLYFINRESRANLSLKDKEIDDILHDMELSRDKDAYSGYICYKEIARLRRERRVSKENISRTDALWSIFLNSLGEGKMRNVINRLERQVDSNNKEKRYNVKSEFGKEFLGKDTLYSDYWIDKERNNDE